MASMKQVLDAMGTAIQNSVNGAALPTPTATKVMAGWPNQDDLTQIIKAKQQQVSLFAHPGSRLAKMWLNQRPPTLVAPPSPTVTASIAGGVITFAGVAEAGLNIHTVIRLGSSPTGYDAFYKTLNGDTLNSIAAAVAAALNALSAPGVSATPSGATVSLTGPIVSLVCNIGQSSVAAYIFARRRIRRVQVRIWSWDPDVRDATADMILTGLAPEMISPRWLTAADGSGVEVSHHDDFPNDFMGMETQFIYDLLYDAEYTEYKPITATPIGVTELTITPNNNAPVTFIDGGGRL
jgi:hypothetical protein